MAGSRSLFVSVILTAIFLACLVTLGLWLLKARLTSADPNPNGLDLQLIPSVPTLTAGGPLDIEVWVIPNGNRVTAAELRLSYDPQVFTPRSSHPYRPGTALSLILPNCSAGSGTPCPATSSATPDQALTYLGVNCTEFGGCPIPDTSARFLLATLELQATATASGITNINPEDQARPTLTAALEFDDNATRYAAATSLTLTPCNLTHDFTGDGNITVSDLMLAAARWQAGPEDYNGQYDLNRDGAITVTDLQAAAQSWSQSCVAN